MELRGIFRTRHPDRNRRTDADRRKRLCAAIDAMQTEIRFELNGIRRRYEATSTNAAFLFDAIENGESDSETRLDELSASMKAYEARVGELAGQIAFLSGLREAAAGFGGAANATVASDPTS